MTPMSNFSSGTGNRVPCLTAKSRPGFSAAMLAALAGLGLTALSFAASKPARDAGPERPDYAALQQMMNERMGKAPIADQAISADGVQVVFQSGHAYGVTALAMSADGRLILTGSQDETAKLWDVASGREVRTLAGFGSMGPRHVQISTDGERLIVSDMQNTQVFDAASGQKLRTLSAVSMSNLVSNDGRVGVDNSVATSGRVPSLVDLASGQVIWQLPLQGDDADNQPVVALSGDGKIVVTRREGQTSGSRLARTQPQFITELDVWDVTARKLRSRLQLPDDAMEALVVTALSPDGRLLACENRDRTLSLYDLPSAKELLKIPTGATAMAGMSTTLVFSPDSSRIAYATSEGPAKIWDTASGRLLATVDATAVNFSPDGARLLYGRSQGGAPVIRDLASGKDSALTGGASAILDMSLALGGRAVVAATVSGAINVWELGTAQLLRSFDCPSGVAASSASASRAGSLLAVGCMDGSAVLWDLASGAKLHQLLPPRAAGFVFTHAAFSHDGKVLAVAVGESIVIFDPQSGRKVRQWDLPPSASPQAQNPQMMALDPEFLKRLPASQRRVLEQQQAAREQEPEQADNGDAAMEKLAQSIDAIAIHPDGRAVVTGRAYEVALWDIATGQRVRQFGGAAPLPTPDANAGGSGAPEAGSMADMIRKLQRGGSGGLLGGLLGGSGTGDAPQVVVPDLSAIMRSQREQFSGASSLAFSDDGQMLLTVGSQGKRLWKVATGQALRDSRPAPKLDLSNPQALNPQAIMAGLLPEEMGAARGTAVSSDGRLLANGNGRVIKLSDAATGEVVAQLIGHTSDVSALAFADHDRLLVSGGMDGALRVWEVSKRKEAVALIALGRSDYVAVTPDQFYRASKSHIKGVAFRVKGQLYPFEQFDLRFNRPDVVLERLGLAAPEEVQSYRRSYERRLRKMGITADALGMEFHLPSLAIVATGLPVSTADASLKLRVRASDDKYPLERFNVFVNDVPVYGTAGLPLSSRGTQQIEQELSTPLVAGRNKIQVSVLNAQGTESLRQTLYITSTADPGPTDVYVVAIGVSTYKNSAYNLRYAAKDAGDLLDAYRSLEARPAPRGQVHVLDLSNSKATRDSIRQAKEFLKQARVNDLAVVFAAGHGMTDAKQNYYFGTWDIDPARPELNGLPYEDFEGLLDGIAAMQKMLLLDTCFSGEIDKDEPTTIAAAATGGAGTVNMRAFKSQRGVSVVADADSDAAAMPGTNNLVRFQQDWFADLRRGTGAVVISSASGNEFALEGEQWRNGVFTYALLNGLKNRAADSNKNSVVTVGELQAYVIEQVRALTDGGQNPTVRRENLEYDFAVF